MRDRRHGRFSNNYQLVLPTEVGAVKADGELPPTQVGGALPTPRDHVVDGVDTRPPPTWTR